MKLKSEYKYIRFTERYNKRMHLNSPFMAQQCVQYITLWLCCTTKEKFHIKSVLFYPPNVLCRWLKLEFINCIKTKIWCVTRTSNWSVNVTFFVLFFFLLRVNKCFLFSYIGSRSLWNPKKNRSVWISVLCRHKFHLLQINSSEIIATAAYLWIKWEGRFHLSI